MGYEFKVKTKLTAKQTLEIQNLLMQNKIFNRKHEYKGTLFWEFRFSDNKGEMPNFCLVFEEDGIYVCEYALCDFWNQLSSVKEYFKNKHIEYSIIEV